MATSNPLKLVAFTLTTAGVAYQPWATATNGGNMVTNGVLVQSDFANAASSLISVGGPDVTQSDSPQLGPGDTDFVTAPFAKGVWVIGSVNGLIVRGQVR